MLWVNVHRRYSFENKKGKMMRCAYYLLCGFYFLASVLLAKTEGKGKKPVGVPKKMVETQSYRYQIDSGHSRLGFKIRHLGISWVSGHFTTFKGSGVIALPGHQISKMEVMIEANSIDTDESDRDKHLRGKDFFHVKKHPKIAFKMTKIVYSKQQLPQPIRIEGQLSMRGVTKPIVLDVDWGGLAIDPWGNHKLAFEARGKIDRREYGLTWNKGLQKVGGLLVGHEVTLILEIEANRVVK